ncbi:MAG: hypothetical protein CL831_00135 [Crocinitomicaceae bacterium]|nr:hypothetical protein [Crocinitomicaceae bacterium]
MPRKQNGFGNPKALSFKGSGRVDKGKGVGAPGTYPSNRQYGTSVHRTVIEKYNLDSDWVKWRKGFEYYINAAWSKLLTYNKKEKTYSDTKIDTKLYQGTDYEIDVEFEGYKFATKKADSNNHYVLRRTTVSQPNIGHINAVYNDTTQYEQQRQNKEIWAKLTAGTAARLLLRMNGERLTDGETEATLKNVLTSANHPAVFVGKSANRASTVKVTIPKSSLTYGADVTPLTSYQSLIGKIAYINNFYKEKNISSISSLNWVDSDYFFETEVSDTTTSQTVDILNPGTTELTTALYDIAELPKIVSSSNGTCELKGKYSFQKDDYQRFYGRQYLTAEVVQGEVTSASYTVLPFTILGVEETSTDIILISIPFKSEFRVTASITSGTLIFSDWSFTKKSIDSYDGNYYHPPGAPGTAEWQRIDTDVNPWMDEVFTAGTALVPATIYACSCPNHSQAIIRAPQSTQDEGQRKINRQRQYPLPTVMGKADYEGSGIFTAAGLIESWESNEHKMSFKMCKHSIATMFVERIKIKEPNKYPTLEAREAFDEKLKSEINDVASEFNMSYKRRGITGLEIIFALAQGLNLDDTELAYVMFNNNF